MQIAKSIEWIFRPLPVLPNSIDEDDVLSLSMLYKCLSQRLYVFIAICLVALVCGIAIYLLTMCTSLMMLFISIGMLRIFELIPAIEDRAKAHRNIVRIASNRGESPYNEVLVYLDVLGADIKLTRRKYYTYCRHWNFDTVYNNEEQ